MEGTFGGRQERVGDLDQEVKREEKVGGWKVVEQERHGRLDRKKEEGRAKSNKMKLGSPLLFPFRNVLSLKGFEINTKKHFNIGFEAWSLAGQKDISP